MRGTPSTGRGVDGPLPDSAGEDRAVDLVDLVDSVDGVRESTEFFAAVTEVRESLRKGST